MKLAGETRNLSGSERIRLEKLLRKRSSGSDIVDPDLARRFAEESTNLDVPIALLLGRDGRIEYGIVGTKQRVYLPDLGRYRLDESRLRRLRLIVFMPSDVLEWVHIYPKEAARENPGKKGIIIAPKVAPDFITDLEKLRLDLLAIIAVDRGMPSSTSIAYLSVREQERGGRRTEVVSEHYSSYSGLDFDFALFITELERSHRNLESQVKEVRKDSAVLVGVYTGSQADAAYSMDELRELSRTAGVTIADTFIQKRSRLDPKTVLGKGKIEELVLRSLDLGADMLIFDCELSPSQLRAITLITELKILDRSMLILDIFAQRAKSAEGRLQVELAQLKYSLPRLSDRDSGLSRLTGGIGGRGPGETKLEVSRRRVRDRISDLESKIEKISRQRGLRREKRQLRGVPVISIVGYTNSGKSTLLNTITKGETLAENKLFATLDPSSRRMRFPNDKEVIFVDTVGFIRDLPEELVGAFRATLEEVGEADLLLHVVDGSHFEIKRHIEVVEATLQALGFDHKPALLVVNKCDLLTSTEIRTLENSLQSISVSALTREGIPALLNAVIDALNLNFKGRDPGGFLEIPGA
ncbi:MAG TPA: GTPase HflX [Oligoflexia bacterium]|nr:GTPase HflX [Oligoflexia bacterium]HMP49083.1 GTPase HflX [Oligoflexia bacterium]